MMNDEIVRIFNDCGIRDVGFCAFDAIAGRLLDCRAKARLPENARTVILCTFPYKVEEQPPERISRYAAVPDYHRVGGEYLGRITERLRTRFPANRFAFFLDNSPVPEVFAAVRAGLGVRGENGLLITPEYGSWVFLGEIVTDLELACAEQTERCPGCGACRDACPMTRCGTVCLSAVTQKKGTLTAAESAALCENGLVWGCDRCAECCPLNKKAKTTYLPEFQAGYRPRYTPGEDISGRAYEWRGEATVRRNAAFMPKAESKMQSEASKEKEY